MFDLTACPACQATAQNDIGTPRYPKFLFGPSGILPWARRRTVVFRSAFHYWRTRGLSFVLQKSFSLVAGTVRKRFSRTNVRAWKTPVVEGAVLDLKPGEWVEVKSLNEIQSTLDSNGKTHGLFFTNEMKLHCGRPYRVFKSVNSIFNEFTKEQRKVRNTVLLDAVFCRGEGLGCDRSCFHMWREAWLRRIPEPSLEARPSFGDPQLPVLNNRLKYRP